MAVRPKGPGKWQLIWEITGEGGERRQQTAIFYGTLKEAEIEQRKRQVRVDGGGKALASAMTFRDLANAWYSDVASPHVAGTTLRSYEQTLRNHLLPDLGNYRLRDLTAPVLQRYVTGKLQPGQRKDGRGDTLGTRSVQNIYVIMHIILEQAVEWDYMPANPADRVKPPKLVQEEARIWTEEESARFLDAASAHPLYALFLLALTTGMREGELLGVRWRDLDLAGGMLRVEQSVVQTRNGREFGKLKTKQSRRAIDIGEDVVAALRAHKARQNAAKLRKGAAYQDLGLVFATRSGKPISASNLARLFHLLSDRAGVPRIKVHATRHTVASDMLSAGENPKVVQERLGHSTAAFTVRQYGHSIPGMQQRAAQGIEERLRRGRKG